MIAIGSDHGGFELKQEIMAHLTKRGLEFKDFGTYTPDSCDYPVYGRAVAKAVASGECERGIGRVGGIILALLFAYFLYNTFRHAKEAPDEAETVRQLSVGKAVTLILLGLVGLTIGGELIVKSAVNLATRMGVSQAVIGLTIVALGTSLPELATSVIAATKHKCDIALGNVIGSNIFNVFFVLSTSAIIRPLPAYDGIELDALMAMVGSALVWLFVKTNPEREIKRWGGAILLIVYAAYLTYRLMQV